MACSKTQRKTGLAEKEAGVQSALLFTCLHAPLIQAADPILLRLWRGCGQTKGRSGESGAQYPGKMLESWQVLPFQAQRVRGAFTNVTHESIQQHLEATQRSPEAAIHHNQHLNTVLRTPGGGDWRISIGTRQGDFGCDIFLGVYDIPLKKYVNGRRPKNEVMKLEGHEVDVSLLTSVDDLMDKLIESTPSSMRMRDTANDKKLTQELEKVGCKLEPSKEESLLRWMGPNARNN